MYALVAALFCPACRVAASGAVARLLSVQLRVQAFLQGSLPV